MAVKEVIQFQGDGEGVLSADCLPVKEFTEDVVQCIQDLKDTAASFGSRCLGLSANQIGYTHRIVLVKAPGDEAEVLINPEITLRHPGVASRPEGCLSRDGMLPVVKRRHKRVNLSYTSDDGERSVSVELSGIRSRIVQHEIDHLNGRSI